MVQTQLQRYGPGAIPLSRPESVGGHRGLDRSSLPASLSVTVHDPHIVAALRSANYLSSKPTEYDAVTALMEAARLHRRSVQASASQLDVASPENRSFLDNGQRVHERVVESKCAALRAQFPPYGTDDLTRLTVGLMKLDFGIHARVWLLGTGTQANALGLGAICSPRGSILCAETAHIFVNEANAIDRQIIPVQSSDGKVTPENLSRALSKLRSGTRAVHGTSPEVLYLSNATELGTIYSRLEMSTLGRFCAENCMHLWVDGARLPYAAAALRSSLKDLTTNVGASVVTLGLDKIGGSDGTVLLFLGDEGIEGDFHGILKNGGALRASFREISSQVVALFESDLADNNCQRANILAAALGAEFESAGFKLVRQVESNAVLVEMHEEMARTLQSEGFSFSYPWEGAARFMVSYAHSEGDLQELVARAKELKAL